MWFCLGAGFTPGLTVSLTLLPLHDAILGRCATGNIPWAELQEAAREPVGGGWRDAIRSGPEGIEADSRFTVCLSVAALGRRR
jgi:hypothetical protein